MVNDLELARRAVACKRWRWLDGMLVIPVGGGPTMRLCSGFALNPREWLPALSDPATLGCLLALVRDAWGDAELCANNADAYDCLYWHVYTHDDYASMGCQTEAAALVAALEAAP